VPGGSPGLARPNPLQGYKDCGLGDVVCNVALRGYMDSEENWKNLEGELLVGNGDAWRLMDPATTEVRAAEAKTPGRLRLSLARRQTILLVQ
jgi:hypothetical protein